MSESRRSILVVEDDVALSRLFRTALGVAGFEIRLAANGLEALRELDSNPPDLVVLDLNLPYIDGLAVQQEIAAHAYTRRIPIVIATGSTMDLSHLDVQCVLRKPISPDELVATVQRCLASGAPRLEA